MVGEEPKVQTCVFLGLFHFSNDWYFIFSDQQTQLYMLRRKLGKSKKAAFEQGTRKNLLVQ